MQLKRTEQTDAEKMQYRIYAAMETGNTGQARTLMAELRDVDPVVYTLIRTGVIRTYGVSL